METNDNKKSARSLYLLFGAWYAMGSAISTLLTVTLADKLTKEHFSGKMLGSLMAVTALPWVLKPIWGILIDRFKTMYWWAMAASVAASFSVLVVAKVEASLPYWLIVALVLIPNILRSLQDVAVDGLSVAVSREEQRGAIQKWMRIGTIIGTLLGGAGAMYFMEKNSWFTVCVTMMVISVIIGVIVPWLLATTHIHEGQSATKPSWSDLGGTLKSPMIILGILLATVSIPAQQITGPLFYTWWNSPGYSKGMVSVIFTWAPLFQILGAMLGGLLVKKMTKSMAVGVSLHLVALSYCAIGFKSNWSEDFALGLSWLTGFSDTVYAVALFALLMDLADKKYTAMSFALFMAATNLCGLWGPWLGGELSTDGYYMAAWSMDRIFLFAGLAQIMVLPIVFSIEKAKRKQA